MISERQGHSCGYLVTRSPVDELPPTALKAKGGAPSAISASDDRSFAVTASRHRFVPVPSLKVHPGPGILNGRGESVKGLFEGAAHSLKGDTSSTATRRE